MALAPGTRLGPYEILSAVGKGGMGEVFRARDTRLDRVVAIKLIRAEFSERDDFRHRFEREARAISALNHPHICSLYDIGEQDGSAYLVMEHVEGETLAEVMKRGVLPLDLALRYGGEIAAALAAAHARGIVHRDLKPANVMITPAGVKVLDFGLAKRSDPGAAEDATRTVAAGESRAGQVVGTVEYMSPEQAEGRVVDAHSDIFSLGVVLYEMVCGTRPFRGDTTLSTLASILRETPESPRRLSHDVTERVEQVVLRCLEKRPEARFASASDVHRELAACHTAGPGSSVLRRTVVAAAAVLLVVAVAALGTWAYVRAARVSWAESQALPEIAGLLEDNRLLSALRVYREAERYTPSSRWLLDLTENLYVQPVSINSTPPGAEVYVSDYADTDTDDSSRWTHLGQSPIETVDIPFRGYYLVRAVMEGHQTIEQPLSPGGSSTIELRLHASEESPTGMVWVPGAAAGTPFSMNPFPSVEIEGFWLDKTEVTNRQFKEFVDAGGYQKREYWQEPFVKDGRPVTWEEAIEEFRDATGRSGPSTWALGTYPEGQADFPVGGVSWYEAAAYAEFAGKRLPSVYHWYRAAGVGFFADILKFSNFSGRGPAPAGAHGGLSRFGALDMAGNVKEWAWNLARDNRFALGGGWDEPSYRFNDPEGRPPFSREATLGFRCAIYPTPPSAALLAPTRLGASVARTDPPADENTFQIYRRLYAYDRSDLDAAVEGVETASPYMRREDITFRAAYGDERMVAHLFLPREAAPPYQVVAFMGGGNMPIWRSVEEVRDPYEFIVRSGRALLLPAYKGTLERGPAPRALGPNQVRDMLVQWSKDLARSIDYLETRPDIDVERLGFYGMSAGAAHAPRVIAVEPRIKVGVLISGGARGPGPPEIDPWNFAPRVSIPMLMLNGRNDFTFPVETSQIPLFRALGTPEADKKHVLFDGGHVNLMTRLDLVREILDWLDQHLGPVSARAQDPTADRALRMR
jgi:formylglycine-generating enzyme required for sulfatase activity/dienelactone hydrolase